MNIILDIKSNESIYTQADLNNVHIGHKLDYTDKINNLKLSGVVCSIEHEIDDNDDHLTLIKIY